MADQPNNITTSNISLKGIAIHCEGDLSPEFVGKMLGQVLSSVVGVATAPLTAIAAIAQPAQPAAAAIAGPVETTEREPAPKPKRKSYYVPVSKRPGRKPKPQTFDKPPDEPDGFGMGDPSPSRAAAVGRGGSGINPKRGTFDESREPHEATGRPPGILASQIIKYLDERDGVAPLEVVAGALKVANHSAAMAVGKCDKLKKLSNGRIALAAYNDED